MRKFLAGKRNAFWVGSLSKVNVFYEVFQADTHSLTFSLNAHKFSVVRPCVLFGLFLYKVDLKFKWGKINPGVPKGFLRLSHSPSVS